MKLRLTYNKISIAAIAIVFLLIVGCEDFLKEEPKNFLNPADFYKTLAETEGGLTGVYSKLISLNQEPVFAFFEELHADYHWAWNINNHEIGYIRNNSENIVLKPQWEDCYQGIKNANSFIYYLAATEEVSYADELKARFLGEARFVRAYLYYLLAISFEDVPLVLEPYEVSGEPFPTKTEQALIFDFIIEEMKAIIPDLPEKSQYSGEDVSRASKGAAQTLLAKTYLWKENWTEAKTLVDQIITSGEYELEEDITNNWNSANEHGKESIFETDMGKGYPGPLGNSMFQLTGPPQLKHPITGNNVGGMWGGVSFCWFFYQSFDDNDQRKQKLFYEPGTYVSDTGRYYTSKYFDPNVETVGTWREGVVNMVVYRYADILLMKAEIENELNDGPNAAAYDAINQVRARAEITDLTPGLSYNDFLDAVFEERAKELFFENHRVYDLKRRGFEFLASIVEPGRQALLDHLGIDIQFKIEEYQMKFPIPQAELDANPNLLQHDGY